MFHIRGSTLTRPLYASIAHERYFSIPAYPKTCVQMYKSSLAVLFRVEITKENVVKSEILVMKRSWFCRFR